MIPEMCHFSMFHLCRSCHELFTRLNQLVTESDYFIFTQVILQCKITGIVLKNLLSYRNIARLKSFVVQVCRMYNNSVFLRFEPLGSIQLTVRGYVKLFLSGKLLRFSQENLYPSVNCLMKQGLEIEHGVCDLKCVNLICNIDFKSIAPLVFQILTGNATNRPAMKTKDPDLNVYITTTNNFIHPLKGEFLIRFAPLCSLELHFSKRHSKLISNSLEHVAWLENELNNAFSQEMDNEPGKSTFMKLHLQASKADLTWTIGEKLQFLKQVASSFPTMNNLSAEVDDSTPVQSSDFQWEEIHADFWKIHHKKQHAILLQQILKTKHCLKRRLLIQRK